ncbi:MAG: zinc ribbon domain-containing protein [Chloroflexi bacterium]|nr:zinc ribbon domain-containing protein [Chloroflexota bacterium]
MPKEIQQILDTISQFWDSPVVQFGLRAIGLYIVVLWFAAAYWAFRDMQLRTANPILPYLAAGLIILFSPILFPFAIVAYKIVRPQEKIGEVYERTLAEEALLAEVEAVKSCPTCARRVNDEWIICPTCRTRLNRVCPNCSRLVGLDWSLCAWCGRDFERPLAAVEPIHEPRERLGVGRRDVIGPPDEADEYSREGLAGASWLPPEASGDEPSGQPARGGAPALARMTRPPTATGPEPQRSRDGVLPAGDGSAPRSGTSGSVRRRSPGSNPEH